MQLFIHTQVRENYGAHGWDGTGECPQYWKSKGGETYKVRSTMVAAGLLTELVMAVRERIETNNHFMTEEIVDWGGVGDDALTEFEQNQLKHEGKITYPAAVIEF